MRGKMILAIDAGLSFCKAVLFGEDGAVLVSNSSPTPVRSDSDGGSEIDMAELWNTVAETVRKTVSGFDAKEIAAVGISGHGNGLYCLDASGAPAGNAVTSMDLRASAFLPDERRASVLRSLTLQKIWAGQPGIILRRMKRERPRDLKRIRHAMFCKDYLSYKLAGKIHTDFSDISASGLMNNLTGKYDPAIFGNLELPELADILPPVIRGFDMRGAVTEDAAAQTGIPVGTSVIGGMFDVDACVYGAGAVETGKLCAIAGTWNINTALVERPVFSPEIRQCVRRTDGVSFMLIDSSPTSAVNIEWMLKKFFTGVYDYGKFESAVQECKWKISNPYWLPFVSGSLETVAGKGALLGVDITHGAADMMAAVAEGVCFAHRFHFGNLAAAGAVMGPVRFSGGAARPAFCRLFADVCGLPVETCSSKQTGAEGVRTAALVALGRYPDMGVGVKANTVPEHIYEPDKYRHKIFQTRYERFKELIQCRL
jgi:L-xylulokinase